MPTYQYACTECDHRFEQVQKFTDDALSECPVCHGRLRKVYNAVGVVFKGSGFYRTDSRQGAGSESGSSSGSSSASSGSSESSSGGSTEKSGSAGKSGSADNDLVVLVGLLDVRVDVHGLVVGLVRLLSHLPSTGRRPGWGWGTTAGRGVARGPSRRAMTSSPRQRLPAPASSYAGRCCATVGCWRRCARRWRSRPGCRPRRPPPRRGWR